MPPSKLGPYLVVKKIGSGGMGDVYLAEDPRLERRVALKRVSEDSRDSVARARLIREAKAAARIDHPNIATIHDIIEVDGDPYIVMEFVEGETLGRRLERGPLAPELVVEIALQLASALRAAHALGIIHRDLKPSNVILRNDGTAKVLDFGLAMGPATGLSRITESGAVVGTPAYMSPEQALGGAPDRRSDVFSLGLLLLECLTGETPNRAVKLEDPGAPVVDPVSLEGRVPQHFAEVILKAIAISPESRHPSADDLWRDFARVRAALEERETMARPPRGENPKESSARRLSPWTRRQLAAAVVLGTLAALFWLYDLRRNPVDLARPVVAVLPLANLSGDPSLDPTGLGMAHTLISSLSKIPSITMVSRATTREFAQADADAGVVARDLGASFVVKGSVQRAADKLKVAIQLVREDDSIVWAADYVGIQDDLFALQRRMALGLSEALRLSLSPEERTSLDARPTANNEAFAEYTQGHAFLERTDVPGNVDRAIELFTRATERDPGFAQSYAGLGEAYGAKYRLTMDNHWMREAIDAAEHARTLDSEDPAVGFALATVYHATGREEAAIESLESVLSRQPNDDEAHSLLGQIWSERGLLEEAASELRRAIEIRPGFWGHHRKLGIIYYEAGRYYDAIDAVKRVTELQPDLSWGFQTLGLAYHVTGDLDRAVTNYRRAIELGGSSAAYSNLGTIAYRRGDFEEAVRLYQDAIELAPRSSVTHRNLGDAYRRLNRSQAAEGSYARAVELLDERLEVNPHDARAFGGRAVCEAKLGRFAQAHESAERAIALGPTSGDSWYDKAVVHALAGDPGEALQALAKALEHGYSRIEAREDEDLRGIRDMPEFERLMSR